MPGDRAETRRAHEEFVAAHRLFLRYQHRDPAWLIEFLLGEWRRVLGPDAAWAISRQARREALEQEASGAPLTTTTTGGTA